MNTPDPANELEETAELTCTVHLAGKTARRLQRAAAIQQRPAEYVAAECIHDELDRDLSEALYTNVEDYAATLDGLAERLALMARELVALPSGAAARVIALAQAEKGGHFPDMHERVVQQLTRMWAGRLTEFGERADGSAGPLENTKVDVMVTPDQWDALARIGNPDSLAHGAQHALEAGIATLDH